MIKGESLIIINLMDFEVIDKDLLNDLLQKALQNERHRYAYDLRNSPEDDSQRILNTLLPDTEVPIHRHEDTNETIICFFGRLDVVFYEETKEKGRYVIRDGGRRFVEVWRYNLYPEGKRFGVQVPKGSWHTVEAVFPSCIVEMKDGRYRG